MALRNIVLDGDPILKKKCRMVERVDDRIREILNDMAETMYHAENGAGLAASQVGILKRLVVIDMGSGLLKLVNPEIITEKGSQEVVEGCLSFPGQYGRLIRPRRVKIKALDENGEEVVLEGEGDMAKAFCHEIDHLDGIVFIEKVKEWL